MGNSPSRSENTQTLKNEIRVLMNEYRQSNETE